MSDTDYSCVNCDDAKARKLVKAIVKRELSCNASERDSYVSYRGYRWGTAGYFFSNI